MVTASALGHRTFLRRLVGAAMLDPATYEEIEADVTATRQATRGGAALQRVGGTRCARVRRAWAGRFSSSVPWR